METQDQDKIIQCRDCPTQFAFSVGEQKFFAERNFTPPTRCKPCREAKKAQREGATNGTAQAYTAPVPGSAGGPGPRVYDAPPPARNGGGKGRPGRGGGGGGNGRRNPRDYGNYDD